MRSKQEIMKEQLDEIRQENRLVAQRRAERYSDTIMEMEGLPKGRGPFYNNRAMYRSMIFAQRIFRRARRNNKHYALTIEDRARLAIEARKAIPASSARSPVVYNG